MNTSAHSTVVNGALSEYWLKAAKTTWSNKIILLNLSYGFAFQLFMYEFSTV